MVESTSWKGHSFTLMVFVGITVLCSIFFVLGMLLGRDQGQRITETALAEGRANPVAAAPSNTKPELAIYDSVEEKRQPALEPPKVDPPPPPAKIAVLPSNVINIQVAAVKKAKAAEKLLKEVQGRGFRALILAPSSGDSNPLYRVQVGPYTNAAEAEMAKRKLEAAGYKPLLKK